MVEKVSMPKDRSSLRIYIVSPRLIHKKNIYSMEEGIAKQLFPGRSITVKILEKYRLSAQYTPEKLYQVYKDSILMEFKNYGMIEYNILRRADTKFVTDDKMVMTIEDNLIYRERSKEVGRILEKIFTERCGLAAEVEFLYKESEKKDPMDQPVFMKPGGELVVGVQSGRISRSRMRAPGMKERQTVDLTGHSEMEMETRMFRWRLKVRPVLEPGSDPARIRERQPVEKSGSGTKNRPVLELQSRRRTTWKGRRKPDWKVRGRRTERKRRRILAPSALRERAAAAGKGSDGRIPYRKSENPDVLYGRDFEGDAVNIHDIDGEIGEVVIRVKMIRAEKRELRSGNKLMIFDLTDFTDSITVKMFLREGQEEDATAAIKEGNFIKIKGITTIDKFDGELTVGSIVGIKKSARTLPPSGG